MGKKNNRKTSKFYGGVVNTSAKSNFALIMEILNHAECEIRHIAYASKSGFVFEVTIPGDLRASTSIKGFFEFNEDTKAFDIPATTLIIKMAILCFCQRTEKPKIRAYLPITPITTDHGTTEREHLEKVCETVDDFQKEAKIEAEIYSKTISRGNPICPSVVDFSYFEDKDISDFLLQGILLKGDKITHEAKQMITYILEQTQPVGLGLGMITMENVTGYDSFFTVSVPLNISVPSNMVKITELKEAVVFQIVRLLVETDVINCDLTNSNALVKRVLLKGESQPYKVKIIDFGIFVKQTDNPYKLSATFTNELLQEIFDFVTRVDGVVGFDLLERPAEIAPIRRNYSLTNYTNVANMLNEYYATPVIAGINVPQLDIENANRTRVMFPFQIQSSAFKSTRPRTPEALCRKLRRPREKSLTNVFKLTGTESSPGSPSVFTGFGGTESPTGSHGFGDTESSPGPRSVFTGFGGTESPPRSPRFRGTESPPRSPRVRGTESPTGSPRFGGKKKSRKGKVSKGKKQNIKKRKTSKR